MNANINELIVRAREGDARAIGKLYEMFRPMGIGEAGHFVKPEDVEDMYQDSFLKAMEHLDSYDASKPFEAWLRIITRNTCKNYLAKKKATNFSDMSDDETEYVDTIAGKDEEAVPDLAYDRKEFMKIIGDIINELPPAQKEAVTLFYYEEMSIKEIASIQGVPEDTVKSRLNYSRKKVGGAVTEYERRTGIKLHGVLLVPLMALFFKTSVHAAEIGTAAKVATAVASVGSAAGSVISKDTFYSRIKRLFGSVGIKILAGVVGATATVSAVQVVSSRTTGNSIERERIVVSPRDINDEVLSRMKREAEQNIKKYIDNFVNFEWNYAKATDLKYEGLAVMVPKEGSSETTNKVLIVYSAYWRSTAEKKRFNDTKVYYPFMFGDVAIYKNGTIDFDLHKTDAVYEYNTAILNNGYVIWGYKDPINMYTDLVRDNANDYTSTPDIRLKRLVN